MKKGFVVAVFLGVAFAAASPHHNDPAASAPSHSTQASAKSGQAPGESTQARPQTASDQAITVTNGLATSAAPAFGWLIVLACTVALMVAMATVVLTATALRG
jgi:hypothetical protein